MPTPPAKQPPSFWVAVNFYAVRLFFACAFLSITSYYFRWQTAQAVIGAVELACIAAVLVGRWRGAPISPPSSGRR